MRSPLAPGRGKSFLATSAAVLVFTTITAAGAVAQEQETGPVGAGSDDAAASCWEIKQNDPNADDGIYWLQTPDLVAPERFYCDMTTDGGGWVLIGRGRENWRPEYRGQGTPAQVRDTVTGTGAFNPRKLDGDIVDGLLNGTRVDQLDDGIRLRRAKNAQGTSWQEARFTMPGRDRWTWAFEAGHVVGNYSFDGASGSGGYSNNFGNDGFFNRYNRVDTRERKDQGWTRGWAYGSWVSGTSGPNSYLWSSSDGQSYPRPFTQVYLRPKLTQDDLNYSRIDDSGAPARELSPLLQSGAEPQSWGVTGRADGDTGEHHVEAQAFTQVGDTVFVGGNFQNVQKGRNPGAGEKVEQSYLAAFDVHSGDWISSFRPTFNAQVKDLITLPGGRLVVAGEFTEVNGQPATGLVALDPQTGEIDTGWQVTVENRLTCCAVSVRSMQIDDDWLYLGGSFTHTKGSNQGWPAFTRNGARVRVSDGSADYDWNPNFNGTVFDIDIGSGGSRYYAVGHFTWSNQVEAEKVAVVRTDPGASLVDGMKDPQFSNSSNYQQSVVEAGDRVFVGGSQHSLFSYARSDFTLLSGNITKTGGDFQSSEDYDGTVYGTCHCEHWNYSEAYQWPDIGTDWTQGDKISFIGAWDAETGKYNPEFNPWLNASRSQGPWGSFQDSTGTVWFSGDFTAGRMNNGGWTWLGGFVRFAPRDTTAPSTPSDLTGTDLGDGEVGLDWNESTDDRAVRGYEILRGDRVIATTSRWTTWYRVPKPDNEADRYFVRAVDGEGNRSASTPVYEVRPAQDGAEMQRQGPDAEQQDPAGQQDETEQQSPAPSTSAPATPGEETSEPSERPSEQPDRRGDAGGANDGRG